MRSAQRRLSFIAKLDRLARNVEFIAHFMNAGVGTNSVRGAVFGAASLQVVPPAKYYAGKMKLMKWQRNSIFDAVVAGGLDPLQCDFDYDDAGARVTHRPSQSNFCLEGYAGHYKTTAVVGELPSWPLPLDAFIWDTVKERVQSWAKEVKDDVDTPDLWAELQRQPQILTGARDEDVENTPFSSDEQVEIAKQIRQISESVKRTDLLSKAQMLSLATKLDDLVTASGRIGRKDWRLMFYGVLFTTIVTDFVPPEVVRSIFTMALHGLGYLFGGALPPQHLPAT
jgi:hypothetical protein